MPYVDSTDRQYLLGEQYRDASKLGARMNLHERFSINQYGWHRWVFDQLELRPGSSILELGCGPGMLWRRNAYRLPANWRITLSDFSPGMVQEARQHLAASAWQISFVVSDAQAIAFADASFDAVVANHMLYHVPEREKAYAEIRRVLRPGGRLYAATNGAEHLRELQELVRSFGSQRMRFGETFLLESGGDELAQWFGQVAERRYEDGLVVTEAEPLVAFVLSTNFELHGREAELRQLIEHELRQRGAIHISKSSGLFIASHD